MHRNGVCGTPVLRQQRSLVLALFVSVLVASLCILHYSHNHYMLLFEAKIAHVFKGSMHVVDTNFDRQQRHIADADSAPIDSSNEGGNHLPNVEEQQFQGYEVPQRLVQQRIHKQQTRHHPAKRKSVAAANVSKQDHLYVSLSSVPGRLPRILPVLRGLLNQTRPADEIFLALPWWSTRESKFYTLPDFLLPGGEMYGSVTVIRDTYDWGPATKMITLLRMLKARGEHNARVVVVDDDQIYYQTFLQAYDKWSTKLPDHALAMRGHKTIENNFDWWTLLGSSIMHAYEVDQPTCIDVMTAVGSYMVRPRFYTAELWEGLYVHGRDTAQAGKLMGARNADDVWVSGMLARNKVPRTLIPGRLRPWTQEMDVAEYEAGMWVKPWVLIQFKGTPELGGGGGEDNAMLLRFFKDDWNCHGPVPTMAWCRRVTDDQGQQHDERLMPTAPCKKRDGTGNLDSAVFTSR